MEQLDDMFEMSNQEAANILRKLVHHLTLMIPRGNGKSLTILRYAQAMGKAIDILENTPDEKTKKTTNFIKLCPDCDGKDFHPVKEFDGKFYPPYKCPKCGKLWSKHEDE